MSADSLTIRPATRGDLAALGRLGALLVRAHYAFDARRFKAPTDDLEKGYAWFLGTQLANRDAVVLVAERAGGPVGYIFAAIEPESWEELREEAGWIHDIAVDERARGHGVAAALMEAAIEWLRERGMPRVLLQTADENRVAQRLFTRLGFRRTMVEMTKEIEEP
jgi:ribosomal protein S18 acetylase RimI-like enzyme